MIVHNQWSEQQQQRWWWNNIKLPSFSGWYFINNTTATKIKKHSLFEVSNLNDMAHEKGKEKNLLKRLSVEQIFVNFKMYKSN